MIPNKWFKKYVCSSCRRCCVDPNLAPKLLDQFFRYKTRTFLPRISTQRIILVKVPKTNPNFGQYSDFPQNIKIGFFNIKAVCYVWFQPNIEMEVQGAK